MVLLSALLLISPVLEAFVVRVAAEGHDEFGKSDVKGTGRRSGLSDEKGVTRRGIVKEFSWDASSFCPPQRSAGSSLPELIQIASLPCLPPDT